MSDTEQLLDLGAMADLVAWYPLDARTTAFALRAPELVARQRVSGFERGDPPTISRARVIYHVARRALGTAAAGLVDDRAGWSWRVGPGVPSALLLESGALPDPVEAIRRTLFGVPVTMDPTFPSDAIRLEVER